VIANSRAPASLAAGAQDLVIIAAPQISLPQLPLQQLRATSVAVVDTGNYYPSRDRRIAEIDGGLTDSEWVARSLGRPVIKAFNNIVAGSLAMRGVPEGAPGRICLSVVGNEGSRYRGARNSLEIGPLQFTCATSPAPPCSPRSERGCP
jgi:predicted dinucleotide-binding enzyme